MTQTQTIERSVLTTAVLPPVLTRLQQFLLDQQIPILDAQQVKAFQQHMVDTMTRRYLRLRTWGIVLSAFVFIASIAAVVKWLHHDWAPLLAIPMILSVVAAAICALQRSVGKDWASNGQLYMWKSWTPAFLCVPQSLVPLALQLEVISVVTVEKMGFDPFLVAQDLEDGSRYYVAWWDENGFPL